MTIEDFEHDWPVYEARYKVGRRMMRNWLKCDDPPPLDAPAEMAAWYRRSYPNKTGDVLDALAANSGFCLIPRGQIDPSGTNPRRKFESLDELAASFKQHGVLEPLLVRPIGEGSEVRFQLVAGERRWRAAEIAGLENLPCIVRELSDRAAVEIQIIENLQRENVTPVEEAQGYGQLLAIEEDGRPVHTVEGIAETIGQSVNYVRDRLKLLNLPRKARTALEAGRLRVKVAEIIGRMALKDDREKMTEMVLFPESGTRREPLNEVEARDLMKAHFQVSLKGVPWGLEEEIGEIPPCSDCKLRSGNMAEVDLTGFAKGKSGVDPNICTAPACYRAKIAKRWEVVQNQAEANGSKALGADVGERIVLNASGDIVGDAKWANIAKKPHAEDVGNYAGKVPTWEKLLDGADVPQVPVQNPFNGQVIYLVDREQAMDVVNARERAADLEKLAEEREQISDAEAKTREAEAGQNSPFAAGAAAKAAKRKAAEKERKALEKRIQQGLDGMRQVFDEIREPRPEVLRLAFHQVLKQNPHGRHMMGRLFGLGNQAEVEAVSKVVTDDALFSALITAMVAEPAYYAGEESEYLGAWLDLLTD